MKKIILVAIISLFIASGLMAQDPLSFEKVIKVDSIKSNAIYNGLKEWIGMNYRSAKAVIEVDDRDAGLMIISPRKDYSMGKLIYSCYDGTIKYTIKFQIKDGRFKVVVTNFIHNNDPGHNSSCEVGLITTSEEYEGESRWDLKSFNNKVWKDIKIKAELLSNDLFNEVGKIKFSTNKFNDKINNW